MLTFAAIAACSGADTIDRHPCPPGGTSLTYDNFGKQFMNDYCVSCHGGPNGYSSRAFTTVEEIRRAVRELEPQKPSTFISTLALERRTTLARQRQIDGAKLVGQIRGDLDWIVMKALEKDRSRRYETADNFAQDLQRHLDCEPVQARPPTTGYRFRRFARRNKFAFAAGTGIAAALVAGLAVSTWMFYKEKHARERAVAAEAAQSSERLKAETEASKSRQVAQFLKNMLDGVGPSVALGRDTVMLREILDKTAGRVGHDLEGQPEVEAELRSTIGDVYRALGDFGTAAMMHGEALNSALLNF